MINKYNTVTSGFMDNLVNEFKQGKISNMITFDEAIKIAKDNNFNYLELIYHLEDRRFYLVSSR